MRILLVKAAHITGTQMSIQPPLGLLFLTSSVRERRPGDEIRLVDTQVSPEEQLTDALRDWKPDVVGISALTAEAAHALYLAGLTRRYAPSAIVVMGGPHPTGYSQEVLASGVVDVAVRHEGEVTFVELLDALEKGGNLEAVAGISFRNQESVCVENPSRVAVRDLDSLPMPAWDLVDFSIYEKHRSMNLFGKRRAAPIFTSRACPFRCTYCHNMFGKKFQRHAVERVIDQFELLRTRYGVRHFEIVDDIFNIDRDRTRQILQGIIDRGLDIRLSFPNGLRGDLLTEDLVDLFARAGTEYVCLAVETASPRLQKQIRKNLKIDKVEAAIGWFVKRRVFVNCFYMLGFPGETRAEMKETIRFACRQPSHTAMFFIVMPFQGTAMSDSLAATGKNFHKIDEFSYHQASVSLTDETSPEELEWMVKLAYLRFIASPARIWRILRDHRQRTSFFSMALTFAHRVFFDSLNNLGVIRRIRSAAGLGRKANLPTLSLGPRRTSVSKTI